ncbi:MULTISPECIES: ACT domain-containing protein [unclassified Nocardiopsis]|uniref:ACT domain-containing protein n=1 Tax=unclassified Nocardiopsis TaxID=2649073 RepID=UPI001358F67C|nr:MULTISPECIES: ACT domain-containing protein [unclassified Nocardiopsis]
MDVSEGHHGTHDHRHGFFGREVLELGTLLLAAGAAHLVVLSLGHSDAGVSLLIAVGLFLLAVSAAHRWHRHRTAVRRRRDSASHTARDGAPTAPAAAPVVAASPDDLLWSVRVTVSDVPGGLAALTTRFAALGVDIRLMQVHPTGTDAIDEFFVSAPAHLGAGALHTAVREAGGRDAAVRRADVHELSDTTSRTLTLVSALVGGSATLERSLLLLAAAQDVRRTPGPPEGMAREELSGTAMTLPAPDGAVLTVRRHDVPFTPVEFARCRALVHVAASLRAGPRPVSAP